MKKTMQIILIILAIALALSGYSLWSNNVPWGDPGFWPRLKVYLSQNVAETSEQAAFPELKPKIYPMASTQLLDELTKHIVALGWNLPSVDADKLELCVPARRRLRQQLCGATL